MCLQKLYHVTVRYSQPLISAGKVTLISNRLFCDAHCMFKDAIYVIAETRTEVRHNNTLLLPPFLFSFWSDLSLFGCLPLKCLETNLKIRMKVHWERHDKTGKKKPLSCFTYTCTS